LKRGGRLFFVFSFRFVSFRFVSFRFVSFRFVREITPAEADDLTTGKKTHLFAPVYTKHDHFAKTGSGQTQGKHSKRERLRFLLAMLLNPIAEMAHLRARTLASEQGAKDTCPFIEPFYRSESDQFRAF
jgi:hypothetical protein